MTSFSERSDLAEEEGSASAAAEPTPATLEQAYGYLFLLLCDPHEEILAPAPGWAPSELAHLHGVHLARYPLARRAGGWAYDAAAIYDAIGERTRAIVVASPCEPTGAVADADALESIGALGLPVILDRSLAGTPLDALEIPAPVALDSLTFVLEPGLRISVGGPEGEVREALERLAAIERAHRGPVPLEPAAVRANLERLRALVREAPVAIPRVEGGRVACVRMPASRSGEDWARALGERGALVRPGGAYELEGPWIVVSLAVPTEDLERTARAIAELARADRED